MKRLMTSAELLLLSGSLPTLVTSAAPGGGDEATIPRLFKQWPAILKKPAQKSRTPPVARGTDPLKRKPLPPPRSPTLTIFFHTGSDQVADRGREKLAELSHVLHRYPRVRVRLNGHTDPRGTDGYNNVLSQYRARHVAAVLESRGVDTGRLEIRAFGTDKSQAPRGDHRAYATERRVVIELQAPTAPPARMRRL